VRDGELAYKAERGDGKSYHDERGALLDSVRPESEYDCHDHREDIDGDCEELGVGGGVAELLDHCWDGGGESLAVYG
jgi:hypothetical protein